MENQKKIVRIIILWAAMHKYIVLFKAKNYNLQQIRTKAGSVAAAILTNIGDYPTVLPLPPVVTTLVSEGNIISGKITDARIALKALEDQEAQNSLSITNIMNLNWNGQVQTDAAGVLDKITQSGLDVKGMGPLPNKARFAASYPDVYKVNQNVSLTIELGLIASDLLSRGKPYGATGIVCLKQIGGVPPMPNNHPLMVKFDPFSKMKFIDTAFTALQINLIVYYIFYWVKKDGTKGPESVVFFYTIK